MSRKKIIRVMKATNGEFEVRWHEGRKPVTHVVKDPYEAELAARMLFDSFGGANAVEVFDHRNTPNGKVLKLFDGPEANGE